MPATTQPECFVQQLALAPSARIERSLAPLHCTHSAYKKLTSVICTPEVANSDALPSCSNSVDLAQDCTSQCAAHTQHLKCITSGWQHSKQTAKMVNINLHCNALTALVYKLHCTHQSVSSVVWKSLDTTKLHRSGYFTGCLLWKLHLLT